MRDIKTICLNFFPDIFFSAFVRYIKVVYIFLLIYNEQKVNIVRTNF